MTTDVGSGPDPDGVRAALREVTDPDLGTDVLASGLVADVAVRDDTVTLEVEPSGIDPERADDVVEAVRSAVFGVPGVDRVETVDDTETAPIGTRLLADVDRVVAVASAKGGVGKTTVAVGLARALDDAGCDVGLFDADVYGPNVPDLLDVEGPIEATDDGRPRPVDADGLQTLSVGFLAGDAPVAWRGSMAHEAVTELLGDAAWDERDVLVIDLPPGTGDVVLTTLQSVAVDGALLVTTPSPAALADTARSADLFQENGVPPFGVVANMDGFVCDECGHDHDLFPEGDVAAEIDLPVLATLPFAPDLRDAEPGAFADLAATVADQLDALDDGPAPSTVPPDALDLRGMPPRARHETVRREFAALSPGEPFAVVNDHDPRPLLGLLADATGHDDATTAFADPTVRRLAPDAWVLGVTRRSDAGTDGGPEPDGGHAEADP